MHRTVNGSAQVAPVNSLDGLRPNAAKAALHGPAPSSAVHGDQSAMTAIVKDALIRAYGSLKAAAITMEIDQAQLTRELDSGKLNLARLERLDPIAKAEIAARLHDAFGALSDPKDYIRKRLRDVEQAVAEFKQFVETTRVA